MTLPHQASATRGSDLLSLAIEHINFLSRIHSLGVSLSRPSRESLRRYVDLWLPLVQSLPNEKLIPPPDIAWLWHCHRLAPFRYEGFLKFKFGLDCPILEANPPFALQAASPEDKDEWMLNTESQWELKFPEEPFFLTKSTTNENSAATSGVFSSDQNELLDGFDLIASAERQATFLWQVSGPRFADPSFLDQGVSNYFKFLSLKRLSPAQHQMIVPTYQIDLFWHTHILNNLSMYHDDCCRIIGTKLHHDDSLNDRTKGGALDLAFGATSALWKEKYHEEYFVQGGMYRGEPPPEFFQKEWANAYAKNLFCTTYNDDVAAPGAKTAEWTDINGVTSSGEPVFIPPLEKSTKRGFNANPRKEDYIFGRGAEGWGYYHNTTREAYLVLQLRLIYQIAELDSLIDQMKCVSAVCCCGMKQYAIVEAEEKLARLREVESLVATSLQTNTPFNFSFVPEDQLQGDDTKRRFFGGEGGAGGFPGEFYDLAGGCGASADASGGATCGGGACGGGGCGGGGCGGGGCGGGGCGG